MEIEEAAAVVCRLSCGDDSLLAVDGMHPPDMEILVPGKMERGWLMAAVLEDC